MKPLVVIIVLALAAWLALSGALPATVAWTLALLFGAMSLLIIIGNPAAGLIASRRKKNYSFVPFVGGTFGVLALLVCPISSARYFVLIPLLLDITFPSFLYALFVLGAFRSERMAAFEILGRIRDVEAIAAGEGVFVRRSLERAYGKGRWRKMKGTATIRWPDGTIQVAEVHWFECHGIGRKEFKIKKVIR